MGVLILAQGVCVKEAAASDNGVEEQYVQCVCDHRVIFLAASERILQRGDPPFLAPHPSDLHPGLIGCVVQGYASILEQTASIVPLCYSITGLPQTWPRQALHCGSLWLCVCV